MNLIEAIKSGMPFKRLNWQVWTSYYGTHITQPGLTQGARQAHLCYDDILANDWEIQEMSVTITSSQFWKAASVFGIERASIGCEMFNYSGPNPPPTRQLFEMAKRLGLESGEAK